MLWKKLGVVWKPDGSLPWARAYATCPTPHVLPNGVIRIFVQCRDSGNVGRIGYVDVDPENPLKVIEASLRPVLDVGKPGCFDDNGVFQTSVVDAGNGHLLMYYVGFELCHRVRYRLLTGVAVSSDGGDSFSRLSSAPILERSDQETMFRCGPFVMREGGIYRMWYIAGSEWETLEGKEMPVYDLRYMESKDGLVWPTRGTEVLALDLQHEHGLGRPYVMAAQAGGYEMFYSVRKRQPLAYRLGYATSADGVSWVRRDAEMGLDVSESGWDSESVEYAAPLQIGGRRYCFYNGNDFGVTGFGVAELIR